MRLAKLYWIKSFSFLLQFISFFFDHPSDGDKQLKKFNQLKKKLFIIGEI
jgi:hypothetical protein